MDTFAKVFELLGDSAAETLGVEAGHLRTMKARGSIPPEYWAKVQQAICAKGETISLEQLQEMRSKALRPSANRRRAGVAA
ncbi:hypothetical protein [Azorhizobium doebereinerae]|uniref:hypothetical protein n=1 Tax=Azorhizobium doebereinerae TaxID=281091 RepID=UPI000404B803|nr:hypothetical protein [Azorhizobium doebereinerae]